MFGCSRFWLVLISCILSAFLTKTVSAGPTPVVLWHGMGDSCCNPLSLGSIIKLLEEQIPGVYVKSLRIGNNIIEDTENGFFLNVNTQIADACQQLAADPLLKNGYNAIGFSQGGQFLRGVAQRCPLPRMDKLVTLGAQHQGVYGLPKCAAQQHEVCDYIREILNTGAYWNWVQDGLVQAQYWHDPLNEEKYRQRSKFLAEINNEVVVNSSYVANLSKLSKLVLVRFNNDSMVQPRESSQFGFYAAGQAETVLPVQQTDLYTQDRLGLKAMDKQGKIDFLDLDGDHLQFSTEWFIQEIVQKYLIETEMDNEIPNITK